MKKIEKIYEVASLSEGGHSVTSSEGKVYVVRENSCTCPGFSYRGSCKHLGMVVKSLARFPREVVDEVLRSIKQYFPEGSRYEVVGSYRRGLKTVKDVDILLECSDVDMLILGEDLASAGYRIEVAGTDILRGTFSGVFGEIEFDFLRVTNSTEWASYLLYRTGSKANNIRMRGVAKSLGLRLNEHGLFNGDEALGTDSEEAIFKALGLPYLAPEQR